MMVHDTFVALSMSGRDRGYLARTGDLMLDLAVGLHACLASIRCLYNVDRAACSSATMTCVNSPDAGVGLS
jgi:hypothetical protein